MIGTQGLQHCGERMLVEQVAKCEAITASLDAFMPSEPRKFGGVNTVVHACPEPVPFEAIPDKDTPANAGSHRARPVTAKAEAPPWPAFPGRSPFALPA